MSELPKGIHRTRRPKMSMHRGRTWDACDVILPDGRKVSGHMDYTWGTRFYFEHDGAWRVGAIADFEDTSPGASYGMCLFDLRERRKPA